MFDGCSSFNVEQSFQPALMNSSSSDWLHTPPSQMPWSLPDASQPSVMRFTGDSLNTTDLAMKALNPDLQTLSKSQSKRKSWDCDIEYNVPPAKQLITEEKMAENLNCLHISNSYVSHQIGSSQPMSIPLPESSSPSITESASSSSDSPSLLDTTLDGKDRTVSLCEQLRKLISESSVLPSPLLNKVERPTTALVLWQPPGESIFKHVVKATAEKDSNLLQEQNTEPKASTSGINISTQSSNQSNWDDLMDNNNSVSAMDLNLFSGLSTLQPLPSEVPLPDDDFMDMPEDSMMDF